eukprot:TRINITY_DN1982_c0_g1_i5.p2 TRINITY_DN1982_c0_g1~~TRINITY_DN1982_c0_g1_i5.p2  ORF type:complete len:121 (-),score=0.48 TRINITY_DN1982_c0_g1_i5:187-549(-)
MSLSWTSLTLHLTSKNMSFADDDDRVMYLRSEMWCLCWPSEEGCLCLHGFPVLNDTAASCTGFAHASYAFVVFSRPRCLPFAICMGVLILAFRLKTLLAVALRSTRHEFELDVFNTAPYE